MRYNRYTESEIKKLLESMVVLTDTREKMNHQILKYFDTKGIKHEPMKLEHGDYTAMIPKNEELGIYRDIYFNDVIAIERKGSLEELSGNLCQKRTQFENECIRAKGKLVLMIEGASYEDIIHHRYKTQYTPISFISSIRSFQARYNLHLEFTDKKTAGNSIYYYLYYHVREILKNGELGKAI